MSWGILTPCRITCRSGSAEHLPEEREPPTLSGTKLMVSPSNLTSQDQPCPLPPEDPDRRVKGVTFSVIIPTRDRAQMVRRAAESVLSQASDYVETIIVDDGSTDDTRDVIHRLARSQASVRLFSQSPHGAAVARNFGARQAAGDILIFLDSDDELLPGCFKRFADAFSCSSVGAACSSGVEVDANGDVTKLHAPRPLGPAYEDMVGVFLAGTFAVRRDVFLAIGGFASDCRSSQHTEFSLRLLPYLRQCDLRLAVVDGPTVRIHAHGTTHLRGDIENLLAGALYITRTHEQQLRKNARHYTDWCTVAAVYAAKLGRFAETRKLLWKAIGACPRRTQNYARLLLACCPPVARRVWRPESIK